jgi:5-methyltetrahydrofolate--homocysteine methyltransferase
MTDFKSLNDAVIGGDDATAVDLVRRNLDQGIAAAEILKQGLIAAMDIVGERMENEDMFIPEVLMAAQAMGKGVEILKPLLLEE